ncbi:hypothetical protein ACHAXT_011465 [Thalassiosira profunda]
MNLSLVSITLLLALCKAEADPESRGLHRGQGGRPFSAEELQAKIDAKCLNFECNGDDAETLKDTCTFEALERPTIAGLEADEIANARAEFRAKLKEGRGKVMKCACCADKSAEEILAAFPEGVRPFGGGGRPGMGGGAGRPGGQGGSGSRPDIEAILEAKCDDFKAEGKCDVPEEPECTRFDAMAANTRGGRRQNLLFCGCCRGD